MALRRVTLDSKLRDMSKQRASRSTVDDDDDIPSDVDFDEDEGEEVVRMIAVDDSTPSLKSISERLDVLINLMKGGASAVVRNGGDVPPRFDVSLEEFRQRLEPYWGTKVPWRGNPWGKCGITKVCVLQEGDPAGVSVCDNAIRNRCWKMVNRLERKETFNTAAAQKLASGGWTREELESSTRKDLVRICGQFDLNPFAEENRTREGIIQSIVQAQEQKLGRVSRSRTAKTAKRKR